MDLQPPLKKIWLWIDPTRRCNLKCTLCYTKSMHKSEDLEPNTLCRILDNIESDESLRVVQVTLNWRGEPLMNPKFSELLHVFSKRKINYDVQFHTNGTLLKPRIIQQLLNVNMPFTIYISIDGGTEKAHDLHRGKGTFRISLAGAWRLLRSRGTKTLPKIGVYQLDLKEPVSNYDADFVKLSKQVDDYLRVLPVLPDGDGHPFLNEAETYGGSPLINSWPEVSFNSPIPQSPCFWAGNSFSISPLGDVSVCILSKQNIGIVGNLLNENVSIIFDKVKQFRKSIEENGRTNVDHCKSCRKCPGNSI
jgi:sulfatase maturation enzyme AslB (radical SAM superfamily)